MRKIILEEKDIKDFEAMVNSLPCFAKNVSENMAVSQAINALMQFMGGKIQEVETTEDPLPVGSGGGLPKPKK